MPHGGYHGPKKTKKTKKKATSSGGPSPHGGFSSPPPSNTQVSNTQASLPPSMGFQPQNIDPGLQQALKTYTPPKQPSSGTSYQNLVNQGVTNPNQLAAASMMDAGITNLSGYTGGQFGNQAAAIQEAAGYAPLNLLAQARPRNVITDDEDDGDDTTVDSKDDEELTEEEKKEKEKKDKALETAKELTEWWKNNGKGYRAYGDRKTLSGKIRNTQEAVSAKIQDKLNKGYYKIVNQTVRMKQADGTYKMVENVPMIIHASTGTMVNPYTGGIISTQSTSDQGGAYQNDMARALGVDESQAGVFSKEYQKGSGIAVANMKPEHALRFLMKKNKGAFEQFFNMNKDKAGFNPFSASAISSAMGFLLNKITGPEALQVGNNLERAGWGKAIEGEDGKYTIQLTKKGAENWSNSFNVPDYVSSEAIAKDKSKGFLSEILGTKKFPDQPIDLTNLIEQGGYQQGTGQTMGFAGSGLAPITQVEREQGFYPTDFKPVSPQSSIQGSPLYSYPTDLRDSLSVTGTPSSFTNVGGSTTNYPTFTSDGYKIGASVANQNQIQNQGGGGGGGGGGQGGGQTPDPNDPNQPGPLTFDVYGRPITYDYTGGPEQIYLGGGYKRDGQYIGSPYGFSKGGIANFKPYGY